MKQEVGSEVGSEILVWLAQRPQRAQRHLGSVVVNQCPSLHAVGLARTEAAEGAALKTSLHGRDSARAISLRKHTIFIAIQGDSTQRVLALRPQRARR